MTNRNREFALLILLFIIAPGVHFFISGENHLVPVFRSYLVGGQILLGLVLTAWFWRKRDQGKQ